MKLRYYLIILILTGFCTVQILAAQGIRGIVKNEKGDTLSYINILVQPVKKGANTNIDGSFEIGLKPGEYTILFSSIDYKPHQVKVLVGEQCQFLTIVLKEQRYELKEVNIRLNGVDPAVQIMRKAISAAPYYRRQVLRYQAKIYIKGTGIIEEVPRLAKNLVEESTEMEVGKTYVTESVNEISFSQPYTYKEKVVSMRSTMPFKDGPEPMRMVRGSIYNTDYTGIVSPLSPQAFSVYQFKLEGSFYEGGREINKIRFEPKRKGSDVYSGYLYVVEKLWCLHSCVLQHQSNGVNSSIKISFQQLAEQPLVWMPITYDLSFKGDYLGIKGGFRYLGSVSNYQVWLNPNVNHQWLQSSVQETLKETPATNSSNKKALSRNQQKIEALIAKENLSKREMIQLASRMKAENERNLKKAKMVYDSTELQIDSMAMQMDSNYWQMNRPVPLMESELKSFLVKDSMLQMTVDTLRKNIPNNKSFHVGSLIWSGDSMRFKNMVYVSYDGLLKGLRLNSVNGIFIQQQISVGVFKVKRPWRYVQTFHIPIGRLMPQAQGDFYYTFNPYRFGQFQVSAGAILKDYNKHGITPLEDMFQLLFLGKNYSKWYMSEFLESNIRYEVLNGLNLKVKLSYAHRYGLVNQDYFTRSNSQTYSANEVPDGSMLPAHESLQVGFTLQYRLNQTYRIKPNRKEYLANKWPMFTLHYQLGAAKSMQFQQIDLQVNQVFSPWHWVEVQYKLQAGFFPYNGGIYQPDKQYFAGNLSFVTQGRMEERFNDLPYYLMVSDNRYLSWHSAFNFKRIWLKRLPYINLLSFKEGLYVNYLKSDFNPAFYEAGYVIKDLFGFLSVGVNQTFDAGKLGRTSLRIHLKM